VKLSSARDGGLVGGSARADHLTYCTNIHPAETWAEVRALLTELVPEVKAAVCENEPFGVGLRLSALATRELSDVRAREELRALLEDKGLYVFTINGFPYGTFHGKPVKAEVYRPDWSEPERLEYSDALAALLADILPRGVAGSISTVPGCFRPHGDAPRLAKIVENLLRHVATLARIESETGKQIALALEPEPRCLLETTNEAIAFIQRELLTNAALERYAALARVSRAHAEPTIRRHLGVCFDACHAAVEFENAEESIAALASAGISIPKAQLSSGLLLESANSAAVSALAAFEDPVYLHQVVIRKGTELTRLLDLNEAFARERDATEEWRVHFHVPVFLENLGVFSSTQRFLSELIRLQARAPFTRHLEVETYTWNVLPDSLRTTSVTQAIARELEWVLGELC
jgi:hypothetical protein